MTDKAFAKFCAHYPDQVVEVSADGIVAIAPLSTPRENARIQNITLQLERWATVGRDGMVTDVTTGFLLPNGARRSPDCAWTRKARILALTEKSRRTLLPLCPDFVIETKANREKMREWISNGAQLAWLIDPERQAVEIYRRNRAPETLDQPATVEGEGPVRGLVLQMKEVWKLQSASEFLPA